MFLIPEDIVGNVRGTREEKKAGSVLAVIVTVLLCLSALPQPSFMLMLTVLQVSGRLVGRLAPGSRLQAGYRFLPQVRAVCSAPWSPRHKTVKLDQQVGSLCSYHLFECPLAKASHVAKPPIKRWEVDSTHQ